MEIEHEVEKQTISSVAVLLFKNTKVLLVKHKEASGHMNGVYGLPAGRQHIGEIEKQSAVRELREETGLLTTEGDLVSYPHNIYTADIERKDGLLTVFSMHVYICQKYTGILQASEETDPEWIEFAKLDNLPLLPNVLHAIKDGFFYLKNKSIANTGMKNSRLSIIVAIDEKRGIGRNNSLLFKIPEDFKRMKELTVGHPIIMGRKTFESIGRVLPGRTNIIVTRDQAYHIEGAHVIHSLNQAIEIAKKSQGSEEIFIFGGGAIFKQALPRVDRLYLTVVAGDYHADTFFPDYSEFKTVLHREDHTSNENTFSFLDLER